MTNELENYLNETSMNAAKLRTSQRHIDGWRPINSSKNQNGTWTITWNNDPPAPPYTTKITYTKTVY